MTTNAGDVTVDAAAEVEAPAPGTVASDIDALSFDDALGELQRTVAALETGGLPLERTIELYEHGVALHERCTTLLGDAELRIRRLADGPGGRPAVVDEEGAARRTVREELD